MLKDEVNKKIRSHRRWLRWHLTGIAAGIVGAITLAAAGWLPMLLMVPVIVADGCGGVYRLRRIRQGRRILADPMFYLVAVEHDLARDPQDRP